MQRYNIKHHYLQDSQTFITLIEEIKHTSTLSNTTNMAHTLPSHWQYTFLFLIAEAIGFKAQAQ